MAHMVAPLEVGICCTDIDRLLLFYRDALGAELIAVNDVPADKAREAAVGDCGYRVARIQLPSGERIKFLQPSHPPHAVGELRPILERRNTIYLTFIVDDMDVAKAQIEAGGATILTTGGAMEIRPGVSILLATDPEGNLIEFVSYDDLSSYRQDLGTLPFRA